jgi:hypothetical protein
MVVTITEIGRRTERGLGKPIPPIDAVIFLYALWFPGKCDLNVGKSLSNLIANLRSYIVVVKV